MTQVPPDVTHKRKAVLTLIIDVPIVKKKEGIWKQ